VFGAIIHDLRVLLRLAKGRKDQPSAAISERRTLQPSPKSGHRAGYDGAKRKGGSEIHIAVETWAHLPALHVTSPHEQDRVQVESALQTLDKGKTFFTALNYRIRWMVNEFFADTLCIVPKIAGGERISNYHKRTLGSSAGYGSC
jgi:hypothetical protein